MRVIYKYQISKTSHTWMPDGAKVLSVQNQNEDLVVWAIVDPEATEVPFYFYIVKTGEKAPDPGYVFLGTVQFRGGAEVVHVFLMP